MKILKELKDVNGGKKMNRAAKRNMLKNCTPKIINQAFNQKLSEQRQELLGKFKEEKREMVTIMLVMTAYTINYKLGFGKKRLPRIMNEILDNIDCFRTGNLIPEDFDTIREDLKKYDIHF